MTTHGRFTSAKHGRPPFILAQNSPVIPQAVCIPEEILSHKPPVRNASTDRHSTIAFFNSNTDLARITEAIVVSTFTTPWLLPGMPTTSDLDLPSNSGRLGVHVSFAVEQERLLATWKDSLPEELQLDVSPREPHIEKLRLSLLARYIQRWILM
jgi:hypothetical protein